MLSTLITGAASGIGRATALALAGEGKNLVLWDLQAEALAQVVADIQHAFPACHVLADAFDVTDDARRATALEHARATTGIQGFVHAAGISGANPISTFTPESWQAVLSVNLTVAAAMTHELGDDLARAGDGAIVYLSSIEGHFGHAWLPAYCSSKAALLGLARAAGHELAGRGVRVNCVCPGAIDTPMMAPLLSNPDYTAALELRTPLGRVGTPEDIADVIAFLLSTKARFVTGASLIVDGGLTTIGGV
jgi:NAD(P)-dependent dehydrogenase (short-subunit alcohol dehydrogenase family)